MDEQVTQKTKICKYCKSEIPADAKICPNCRKKTKSKKLKWIILGIIALLIIVIVAAGGGDGETTKKVGEVGNDGSTASADEGRTAETKTSYSVGDILQDGDFKIVYVASGDYTSDNEFLQPASGNKYIFVKFAFENIGTSGDKGVTSWDFECYADGYAVDECYVDEDEESGLSATLSPGRSTIGCIYYEVPADAKEIEIEYETNFITEEKIKFLFEGDRDSGYEVPKNTEASANAYKVGDIVEGSSLKISYISCEKYVSDNMFVQPRDGYHYVTLTFEFENTGSSDTSVLSTDFDCYADGIDCSALYLLDDELSATLSAGRKTTGTVTFEVPDGATVVEAEYLSNFLTSDRIVFSVSE